MRITIFFKYAFLICMPQNDIVISFEAMWYEMIYSTTKNDNRNSEI